MSYSSAEIGATVRMVLGVKKDQPLEIVPVARGGSARSFYRVRYGSSASIIFMHYNLEHRENTYYAAIAGFFRKIGVSAPRILHHDDAQGFLIMEDLGEFDLWHYRRANWDRRREYYFKTLDMIRKLHVLPKGDANLVGIPLMEAFGPELYRWERSYFLQHFVQAVCHIEMDPAEMEALEAELATLAKGLDGAATCLIHRDLQSQNVLIRGDEPVLIDFQGMRYGNSCYDLGSLLYDPYVSFTGAEREELLRYYYYGLPVMERDLDHFRGLFCQASVQRLMQALGAYGFLGLKGKHPEFLVHIPSGLANLIEAAGRVPQLALLRNLARSCRESVERM